jgi:hypothetical protein
MTIAYGPTRHGPACRNVSALPPAMKSMTAFYRWRRRLHRLLGRYFDRSVELDIARLPSRRNGAMAGTRNRQAILTQTSYVKLDRSFDPTQGTVDGFARRHTSRQIRYGCTPVATRVAIDPHEILHRLHDFVTFNPACRLTEASVPFGISSPRLPLTVTRPGFVAKIAKRRRMHAVLGRSAAWRDYRSDSTNALTSRSTSFSLERKEE